MAIELNVKNICVIFVAILIFALALYFVEQFFFLDATYYIAARDSNERMSNAKVNYGYIENQMFHDLGTKKLYWYKYTKLKVPSNKTLMFYCYAEGYNTGILFSTGVNYRQEKISSCHINDYGKIIYSSRGKLLKQNDTLMLGINITNNFENPILCLAASKSIEVLLTNATLCDNAEGKTKDCILETKIIPVRLKNNELFGCYKTNWKQPSFRNIALEYYSQNLSCNDHIDITMIDEDRILGTYPTEFMYEDKYGNDVGTDDYKFVFNMTC